MTGLDCNILIRLAPSDHPANARSLALVEAEVRCGETLVFSPLIATEFVHVVTDERGFAPPLTMVEALEWLEDFMASPLVKTVEPGDVSLRQTMRWMRQHRLGRKRILDTHLAAVLHTHGIKRLLTSNRGDFTGFGVIETVVP